jgi:hypothetical protein
MPRTVLIGDDHIGFRGRTRFARGRWVPWLGEAADCQSSVEAARRLRPEVVLLDIQLPGLDGFAVGGAPGRAGWRAAPPELPSRARLRSERPAREQTDATADLAPSRPGPSRRGRGGERARP